MHAIWFSIIVPTLGGAVWIWPQLRVPKIWFGLFFIAAVGVAVWLGMDLSEYAAEQRPSKNLALRTLFLFLSTTDIPALQLVCGLFTAGCLAIRLNKEKEK